MSTEAILQGKPQSVGDLLDWRVEQTPHTEAFRYPDAAAGIEPVVPVRRRRNQPERINDQGEITHGGQGYFEYAALDKTDLKLDTAEQTVAAIAGHAKLSTTWNKRNRFFSMGKPLAVTGVQINPDRARELELMERLDAVKKNWKKLCYAEQFIHLWFSGLVSMIRKPLTWLKHGISVKDRFLQALFLVRNWSTDDDAQDVDFMDYVAPLRE